MNVERWSEPALMLCERKSKYKYPGLPDAVPGNRSRGPGSLSTCPEREPKLGEGGGAELSDL